MHCFSPKIVCPWEPRSLPHITKQASFLPQTLCTWWNDKPLLNISDSVHYIPLQFTVVCSWGLAATLILFWVLIVRRLWSYSPKTLIVRRPMVHRLYTFIVPWTLCIVPWTLCIPYSPMDSFMVRRLFSRSADSFHGQLCWLPPLRLQNEYLVSWWSDLPS